MTYINGRYKEHRTEHVHRVHLKRQRVSREEMEQAMRSTNRRTVMRAMYDQGLRQIDIASAFGLTTARISQLAQADAWPARDRFCALCDEEEGFRHDPKVAQRKRYEILARFHDAIEQLR